jgi:two-component system chemotaxis response regulator CheB
LVVVVVTVNSETLSAREAPNGSPSGFTCPRCGGSMWEQSDLPLAFQCRIGHRLTLGGMLAEHGASRRAKLVEAGRLLAEAAALNRRIAGYAEQHGHGVAAARLQHEAVILEHRSSEVMRLALALLVEPSQA